MRMIMRVIMDLVMNPIINFDNDESSFNCMFLSCHVQV